MRHTPAGLAPRCRIIFLAAFAVAVAQTPRFRGPFPVCDSGARIDVGTYASPVMADWNLDGAKDLVCGQFDSGRIRFYPNVGPDSAPEFNGFEFVRADGIEITLPAI